MCVLKLCSSRQVINFQLTKFFVVSAMGDNARPAGDGINNMQGVVGKAPIGNIPIPENPPQNNVQVVVKNVSLGNISVHAPPFSQMLT